MYFKSFTEMFDLKEVVFPRSTWPREKLEGASELVLFADGPILVCGAVVCLWWKLKDSQWWTTFARTENTITPRRTPTVATLEWNEAVMSQRL